MVNMVMWTQLADKRERAISIVNYLTTVNTVNGPD